MTVVVVTHELESAFKIADRNHCNGQGQSLGCRRCPKKFETATEPRVQQFLEPGADPTKTAGSYCERLFDETGDDLDTVPDLNCFWKSRAGAFRW